jgi:amino acid transporter
MSGASVTHPRESEGLGHPPSDAEVLSALGYDQEFDRRMSLWSNFALGFLYLSPLVGVFSLFAIGLTNAGPPSIWWIVIVACGQLLVALVFGEIVSQYPLAGGVYQWARRLRSGRYAWLTSWIYIAGLIIGITTTSLFSAIFVASLFGFESTRGTTILCALVVMLIGLALNCVGTRALSRISSTALAAELTGVVVVGLVLLLFHREQPVSVLFDSFGAGGEGGYAGTFVTASLVGLLLFYGFEACGEVAEEVPDPARRIPKAMILTVVVGGASAFLSFAGYLLAAPNLPAIISGEVADPISAILEGSVGTLGTKIILVVALTSFFACVMGQQAAASRLLYAFGRDRMLPAAHVVSRIHPKRHVPINALVIACIPPVALFVFNYFTPDSLPRIAAFQMLGGYAAFQLVVLAALLMRLKGWRPAGRWSLGRWGLPINVAALVYGVCAMVLLARPDTSADNFFLRWVALIGFLVVLVSGLLYLFLAHPERRSDAPEGDALEIAQRIRGADAGRSR